MEPDGLSRAGAGEDAPSRVGVVAALPEEVSAVLERLEDETPVEAPEPGPDVLPIVCRGRLAGVPAAVAVTGDGRENARRGIEAFLRSVPVDRLLVIGAGGAVSPELQPCSVILAREVWLGDERRLLASSPAVEEALTAADVRPGVVVTVAELLDTVEAKTSVRERLEDADPEHRPAVADLETAYYVQAAEERGVPWVVLRGVSDGADEPLPSFLNQCRDEGGAVRRSEVVRHAFLHPSVIPELVQLRRRIECCADNLATTVERVLEEAA